MSYSEQDGQVIITDALIEPMAEVLLHRMTLLPLPLTLRQKALGQALFRFIASRNELRFIPAPRKGRWTGLSL